MLSKLAKNGEGFFRSEKEKEIFFKEFKKDMIAGGVSGAVVQAVTHPLDTSIVKAQSGSSKVLSRGDHVKTIAKKIGKGTLASAVGFPVFTSVAYLIDRKNKEKTKEKTASLKLMMKNPGGYKQRLPSYYHTDSFKGVGQTQRHRPTGEVIDNLVEEFINRKPPKGIRKEKYVPVKSYQLQKAASLGLLNIFGKGIKAAFSGGRMKNFLKGGFGGSLKGKSAKAGFAASLAVPIPTASDINKGKSLLEKTTKNTGKIS